MDWRERISCDPNVCHGKACVKGTRIMVSIVLANLAAGLSHEEIFESYPRLTEDDIRACLGYAAKMAHEEDLMPLGSAFL